MKKVLKQIKYILRKKRKQSPPPPPETILWSRNKVKQGEIKRDVDTLAVTKSQKKSEKVGNGVSELATC